MADHIFEAQESTFDAEVLRSELPVLIEFWATWAGDHRRTEKLLRELLQTHSGRLKVGRLDATRNSIALETYKITMVPTAILFNNGQELARHAGMVTRSKLDEMVATVL